MTGLLTNVSPGLARGWHPVARSESVGGRPLDVRLLGRTWTVDRTDKGLSSTCDGTAAYAVADHVGLVWLAPLEPAADLLACPEAADPAFRCGWLREQRAPTAAGLLADNFVDLAHFPFVHAATFGAEDDVLVPPYDVVPVVGGFTASYTHTYRHVEDPGVALGIRPVLQTRRTSYAYAVPFQLQLRLEHLDAGGTTVILFFLQPEDLTSTAIWGAVLTDDTGTADTAELVAYEQSILDEDLALSSTFLLDGLPLDPTVEMHTRADASGLAMRAALRSLVSA